MTDLAVLNPEIEGLLREIASDPTSTLLRLPPSDLRRARQLGHLPDRAGTTGLNLAERELLRRWREEVAYLLLVACYKELTAWNYQVRRLYRIPSKDHSRAVKSGHRFMSAQQCARAEMDVETRIGFDLADAWFRAKHANTPSSYEMAALSGSLVPSEHAVAYAALDLLRSGNPSAAIRLMAEVRPERTVPREMIAMNTAHAYECVGRLDLALATVEASTWPSSARIPRAVAGCALSAQLGAQDSLDRWAQELSHLSDVEYEQVGESVQGMIRRRASGYWRPAGGAKERLDRAGRRYGGYVKQVELAFT